MSKRSFLMAVGLVLAVAAFLRFWHLLDQGFTGYDEGWLIDVAQRSAREWREGDLRQYNDFKSSHTTWALLTTSFVLFDVSERSIQYPFALFGVGCVALLMWLARLMYDRPTALLAGLLLAVSPMHVMYSRIPGIDTPGGVFFLLSCCLLYVAQRAPRLIGLTLAALAAGAATSLAVTANYRILACVPVATLSAVLVSRRLRLVPAMLVGFLAGAALVLLAWDVFLARAFPESGGYFRALFHSDVSMFEHSFRDVGSVLDRFRVTEPFFYLRAFLDLGNPGVLLLVGLALFLLALGALLQLAGRWREINRNDLVLLLLAGVPAAAFSALVFKAPRAFSVVDPFFALLGARALALLSRVGSALPLPARPLRALAIVAATAVVGWGLARTMSEDVIGRSNGFRRAFTEIGERDEGMIVVLDRFVPPFYAARAERRVTVLGMGSKLGDVVRKTKGGYRYWLIDGQIIVFENYLSYVWPAFEPLEPTTFVPAPNYIRLAHFVEHAMHLQTSYEREAERYQRWVSRWGRRLPVYDLGRLVQPLGWKGAAERWYRVGAGIVALKPQDEPAPGYDVVVDEESDATSVSVELLFDYNRLPIEGGIGLVTQAEGVPEGVVFYWQLDREAPRAFLGKLHGSDLEFVAVSQKPSINPDSRLSLDWRDDVARARVDGRDLLSERLGAPARPLHRALVASKRDSLEVLLMDTEGGQSPSARP